MTVETRAKVPTNNKIAIDTQATVAQLTAINNALNESNLNAAALEYLAIDAKKALAEGPNNTVVLMDGQKQRKKR